ncbi:MAG: hypothetical protein ABIQ88_07285 [Chitinophagaceae bacterium]
MYLRLLFLFICLAGAANYVAAQVKPPEIRKQLLPGKGVYRFPAFTEGTIVMRDGIISSQKFNYNISLDEMHFISQAGDTLSVADPVTIHFISLNGSRFYYENGFLQTLDTSNGILLAFKQHLISQQLRTGAYGTTTPHESVRTYSFFNGNGQRYKLGEEEAVTVTAREVYFFGDFYGRFTKAGKAFIYQHYRKQHPVISKFIKTNHTNFNKLDDLIKLLRFCATLEV